MRIKRKTSTIPFGYKLDEKDPKFLVEVPEELKALEDIIPIVSARGLSLREGALWISHKTGRSLSHQGLKTIIESHERSTTTWLGTESR